MLGHCALGKPLAARRSDRLFADVRSRLLILSRQAASVRATRKTTAAAGAYTIAGQPLPRPRRRGRLHTDRPSGRPQSDAQAAHGGVAPARVVDTLATRQLTAGAGAYTLIGLAAGTTMGPVVDRA